MTVFTKIINKEIPARIVAENENFIVFLAKDQVNLGHTLIVPKVEIDQILDLDDELTAEMFVYAKVIAKAIKNATNCTRVIYLVEGFQVPHIHLHLIPGIMYNDNDTVKEFSNEELDEIQKKIKVELTKISDKL